MAKKKKKKKLSIEEEYLPYADLPNDSDELLASFISDNKFTKKQMVELIKEYHKLKKAKKDKVKLKFIIEMIPKGSPRPRLNLYRKCVYVEGAKENWEFFKKLVDTQQIKIKGQIHKATYMDLKYYLPIPSGMTKKEKVLAEKKVLRPISKPDWDNLGKTTDMFNKTLWLDDSLVIDARVRKYYSFKPRIEVKIKYEKVFDSLYNERKITKQLFKK